MLREHAFASVFIAAWRTVLCQVIDVRKRSPYLLPVQSQRWAMKVKSWAKVKWEVSVKIYFFFRSSLRCSRRCLRDGASGVSDLGDVFGCFLTLL